MEAPLQNYCATPRTPINVTLTKTRMAKDHKKTQVMEFPNTSMEEVTIKGMTDPVHFKCGRQGTISDPKASHKYHHP